MTHVLVTCDDGIESQGVHELARAASRVFDSVVLVAPEENVSGCGTSTGRTVHPIPCRRVDAPDHGAPTYLVGRTPAAAVLAGRFGAFGQRPDAVLSGVNEGPNTGLIALHSGTLGGALTAANAGLPAVAVSSTGAGVDDLAVAAEVAVQLLSSGAVPSGIAVNLNVPGGATVATPMVHADFAIHEVLQPDARIETVDGRDHVVFSYSPDIGPEAGSDSALLAEGLTTMTPLAGLRVVGADDSVTGALIASADCAERTS